MGSHETRIQKEADQIMKAAQTQMNEVIAEQEEHGLALRYYKDSMGHTWIYEDGFRKFFRDPVSA